jgi:hypothetical protein
MNDKDILDNAPEGATHFIQQTLSVVYFKFDTHFIPLHWCNNKKGWRASRFFEFNNFRLLADIKRIVELEKEMRDFEHAVRNENELIEMQKNQVIRDLEQRANGIMDVRKANIRKKRTLGSAWAGGHIIHNMQLAEEELRNQAKALKEPKT